jgi:hypothetical protein
MIEYFFIFVKLLVFEKERTNTTTIVQKLNISSSIKLKLLLNACRSTF